MATEGDNNITITLTEGQAEALKRLILDTIAAHERCTADLTREWQDMSCGEQDAAIAAARAADARMETLAVAYMQLLRESR